MLTLKCTKKAQDQIGLKKGDLVELENEKERSLLGAWYINVFSVDRRKCFIFMNERSLLSFILFGIKKSNSNKESIPEVLVRGVEQLLTFEDFAPEFIDRFVEDCTISRFSKTDSRKVLGNMNDLVFMYEHMIWHEGGLKNCDLHGILHRINRTPQRNIGWAYSIDIARELLSANAT